MQRSYGVWLIVAMFAGLTAASAEQSTGPVLKSVQAVEEGGRTLVTIQADGPLPMPAHDIVDGPPRIYLDFTGVKPRTAGTQQTSAVGVVTRSRVALHSVGPNVTRVVLDLSRRETYRVDTDERHLGRIRILVGPASAATTATPPARVSSPSPVPPPPVTTGPVSNASAPTIARPVPPPVPAGNPTLAPPPGRAAVTTPPSPAPAPPLSPAPVPPSPAATAQSRLARRPQLTTQAPTRPALPPAELDAYRQQLSGTLQRMEMERSVIASIDANEEVAPPALVTAAQEFNELRRLLAAIKPSAAVKSTHELLIATCNLGAVAVNLRLGGELENQRERRGNAASAAAGALMFFDLACVDLGCNKPGR